MKIRRLDHISFTVGDIDRSAAFYARFGFRPGRRYVSAGPDVDDAVDAEASDRDIQLLNGPEDGPNIELVRYLNYHVGAAPRSFEVGAAHIAFCVDDVEQARRELIESGVSFPSGAQTDEFGSRWAYMRDPDGNTVEIFQDPPGD